MVQVYRFLLTGGLLILTIVAYSQGQNSNRGSRVILSQSTELFNTTFHIYNPPFAAKAVFNDTLQAKNAYPEELMSSVISAASQGWVDYNTLGGSARSEKKQDTYFEFVRLMDREKNFFELRAKLTFTLNEEEFSIIKFYLHTTELPTAKSGAYVLQKQKNRWYTTSTPYTSDLTLMMMRFQEAKLLSVLTGKKTGTPMMDQLIDLVNPSGTCNMTLLLREFNNWYNTDDKAKLEFFTDKDAW